MCNEPASAGFTEVKHTLKAFGRAVVGVRNLNNVMPACKCQEQDQFVRMLWRTKLAQITHVCLIHAQYQVITVEILRRNPPRPRFAHGIPVLGQNGFGARVRGLAEPARMRAG